MGESSSNQGLKPYECLLINLDPHLMGQKGRVFDASLREHTQNICQSSPKLSATAHGADFKGGFEILGNRLHFWTRFLIKT